MALTPHDGTQLLKDWSGGDQAAADKLMPQLKTFPKKKCEGDDVSPSHKRFKRAD